ncbi:MAG: amidohydrolase family protein [Acidobacteria bacterium]|nr:amidohydrolase family protein [Acidobacteriota bacterium]
MRIVTPFRVVLAAKATPPNRYCLLVLIVASLYLAAWTDSASGQPGQVSGPGDAIAIVNVNVIPMDTERVSTGQTVLVRGDRISAIGAAGEVAVPAGATVIDGGGRYLVPGLTDAHVHLEGDGTGLGTSRPDFGDGPLYLAYGVTTVFNLRGTPVQLDWRRRVEQGDLVGPTIYTSGEFINEPRVITEADVEREIAAQAREGYDLIKFHEIVDPAQGFTTTGLALPPYLKMIEAARAADIPLVGHAPVNLGLEVLLQARQPLAHVGTLSNIYFLPITAIRNWLFLTAAALITLIAVVSWSGVAAWLRRRREVPPLPSARLSRLRVLAGIVVAAWAPAVVSAMLFLPGGPLFESLALRVAFTVAILVAAAATAGLVIATIGIWRDASIPFASRVQAAVVSFASLAAVWAGLVVWVPVAWRSSDLGIERLANRLYEAGIPVMTTLVNYDAIGGPGRQRLVEDPVMRYLQPDVRARWLRGPQEGPPGYRYTAFMKKVAGALHRIGVPLVAGTDAMGFPRIAPGASLHHELRLLIESGLSPYEALRAATVVPATFLSRGDEFGNIAVGRRADFLLIGENPLDGIGRLAQPDGVMARGRWLPREELQSMLDALASDD